MSALTSLLDPEPVVATAGIDLIAASLTTQAVENVPVDWRPPLAGTADALATLTIGPTAEANAIATDRLLGVRPTLVAIAPAREVLPGLDDGVFLHAGPPISWPDCSGPLRGALAGAVLYEGLADAADQAFVAASRIGLSPCHDHQTVGPMAGVVSPSMPVAVVTDPSSGRTAYATLNEGLGKVLRYGAYSPEVIERLRWMEHTLGPALNAALRSIEPIDLLALIAQALQMGDDGHNRNRAATSLLLRSLGRGLLATPDVSPEDRSQVFSFIEGNDHFMLNLVMAAAKLQVDAAAEVPNSSLVTTMARNGTEFGIRLSGTGDRWFTAPAPVVDGLYLGAFTAEDANPDIGDSAITETVGLGGFAMAAAPAIVGFVGGTASGAVRRTLEMYEITLTEHPVYRIPILESRGTPTGIDATLVARTGIAPQINTGIAGKEAGVGMVGAGLVEAPLACFVAAVQTLAEGS